MATNGMTINGLNPLSALTADDKIPVWDTDASGEPTKEITAQNMANSVKSLASLPNTTEMNTAIKQSTANKLDGNVLTAHFATGNELLTDYNNGITIQGVGVNTGTIFPVGYGTFVTFRWSEARGFQIYSGYNGLLYYRRWNGTSWDTFRTIAIQS